MLEHHPYQLGVDLAQDAEEVRGAPFVHQAVAFPKFEDQFDVPPDFGQHQRLLQAEQRGRHVSDQNRSSRQRQHHGTGRAPFPPGVGADAATALRGDRFGDGLHQQASPQRVILADPDLAIPLGDLPQWNR